MIDIAAQRVSMLLHRKCYTPAIFRTLPSSYLPISHRQYLTECYTLVISIFLLGLYWSNRAVPIALPDFSAVSCTEPLLVLSIWHTLTVLYACDFVFFFCLGRNHAVTIACPISQLRRCTEPLLVLSI